MTIRITATDLDNPDETETRNIANDYCLIATGTAAVTSIVSHSRKDGTITHVITIKGIKR